MKARRKARLRPAITPLLPATGQEEHEPSALSVAADVIEEMTAENQLLRRRVSNDQEQIARLKGRNAQLQQTIRHHRVWHRIRKLIRLRPQEGTCQ